MILGEKSFVAAFKWILINTDQVLFQPNFSTHLRNCITYYLKNYIIYKNQDKTQRKDKVTMIVI